LRDTENPYAREDNASFAPCNLPNLNYVTRLLSTLVASSKGLVCSRKVYLAMRVLSHFSLHSCIQNMRIRDSTRTKMLLMSAAARVRSQSLDGLRMPQETLCAPLNFAIDHSTPGVYANQRASAVYNYRHAIVCYAFIKSADIEWSSLPARICTKDYSALLRKRVFLRRVAPRLCMPVRYSNRPKFAPRHAWLDPPPGSDCWARTYTLSFRLRATIWVSLAAGADDSAKGRSRGTGNLQARSNLAVFSNFGSKLCPMTDRLD